MTRTSLSFRLAVLTAAFVLGTAFREASARTQYNKEFKSTYVKEGTPLATAVEEAKCNVCHVGKSKKDRNAYGMAMMEKVAKNEKDTAKIIEALKAIESVSSDPSKPGAPTFGALIEQGKLPGGPVE